MASREFKTRYGINSRKQKTNLLPLSFIIMTIIVFALLLLNLDEYSLPDVTFSEMESKTPTKQVSIMRPDGYDVIDIGASKGSGSINFLQDALSQVVNEERRKLLDPRTLGLDYDPKKVETCKAAQLGTQNDCRLADILKITPESLYENHKRKISGNSYWHVLEHIPNCELSQKMWIKAASLSRSFSSFHGPAFDNALSASGERPTSYHRYWENWTGHTCHFNSTMLERAMKQTKKTTAYIIINYGTIEDTSNSIILPKGSQSNSHHYDPKIHPPKKISLLRKFCMRR